jgi:rod shape determining protein RodA
MFGSMNWALTATVVVLLSIGVAFIFSACNVDDTSSRPLHRRQLVWIAVGVAGYLAMAYQHYRRMTRASLVFYVGALALLVLVLLVGHRIYGARRWLLVGGMTIQPSELAKISTILLLAEYLGSLAPQIASRRTLFTVLAIIGAPMILIMREPDLGTAMVFIPVTASMLFVAGLPWRYWAAITAGGVGVVLMVLSVLFLPGLVGVSADGQQRIMKTFGLKDYHRERILVFAQSERDPLGKGWNKRQSLIAIGSGGFWGKGFRKGTQNILGYLPRSVAPTDFIYSVVAEETGFVGSCIVVTLFGVVFVTGLYTALIARDRVGRLFCTGFVVLLLSHVFVNIGMTVGILPITGVPLPLVSYGGTFMVMVLIGLGLIQSVHIRARMGSWADASKAPGLSLPFGR